MALDIILHGNRPCRSYRDACRDSINSPWLQRYHIDILAKPIPFRRWEGLTSEDRTILARQQAGKAWDVALAYLNSINL